MRLDQLIQKCKKKDPKAQEQLYTLYCNRIFSICLKYSNTKENAEDILQEAFVIIFDKIHQFKNKGSFEGWMKRITINLALQKFRKQRVFDLVDEEKIEDETVDVEADDISLEYLLQCVQQLPDRYRLVFNLYALDDFSHSEISEMLSISIGTSKSNLARARKILKEKIVLYKKIGSSVHRTY